MKVRTDFVTNSSSSSFILQFEDSKQEEKIKEMYYNRESYRDEYIDWHQKKYGCKVKDNPNSIPLYIIEVNGQSTSYEDIFHDRTKLWKAVYSDKASFIIAAKEFGLFANPLRVKVDGKEATLHDLRMNCEDGICKIDAVYERGDWSKAIAIIFKDLEATAYNSYDPSLNFDSSDAYVILKDRESQFERCLNKWKKLHDKSWTYDSLTEFLFKNRKVNPEYEELPEKLALFDPYFEDSWSVKKVGDLKVEAATFVDNFDLLEYLEFCYEKLGFKLPNLKVSEDYRIYDEDFSLLPDWK